MKFFLDSANLDELKNGASWGVVSTAASSTRVGIRVGVTLCAIAGRALLAAKSDACKILPASRFLKNRAKVFPETLVAG